MRRIDANMKRISNATQRIITAIAIGGHLKRVKDSELANHIGGFYEWASMCGYNRRQADRLIALYERAARGVVR